MSKDDSSGGRGNEPGKAFSKAQQHEQQLCALLQEATEMAAPQQWQSTKDLWTLSAFRCVARALIYLLRRLK